MRGTMKKSTTVFLLAALLLFGCAPQAPRLEQTPEPEATTAPLAAVKTNDAYRTFYEIFVGSFYDSDGDGMGDLAGVAQKLDYINDAQVSNTSLHAGGIWLMPIMSGYSYHKYDVTDYYRVDADYGTLADFEALSAACRARGIRLIIDLPINHTSSRHPWFVSACASLAAGECDGTDRCTFAAPCQKHNPYVEYYNFSREPKSGYHPVSAAPGWYFEGQFYDGMPDLNLDSSLVREEILRICSFWLEHGADGFRLDAVTSYYTGATGSNTAFLEWLTASLQEIEPAVYLVGEAWSDAGTIKTLYESGTPSLFNFPFAQAGGKIINAVRSGNGETFSQALEEWDAELHASRPDAIDALFLSNHDTARSAGALGRNDTMIKQAAAVYLLLPGNPFLYYGEEIGMTGGSDNDPNKRMPLIWSVNSTAGMTDPPEGAGSTETVAAGIAEQLEDPDSILRFYIDAMNLRNACPALARGRVKARLTGTEAILAYDALYDGAAWTVVHNLGAVPVTLAEFGRREIFSVLAAGGEAPRMEEVALVLPPGSTVVLAPEQ